MDAGSRRAQLVQRFRDVDPWLIDAVVGTVFTILGLFGLFGDHGPDSPFRDPGALAVVFALVCSVPYFFRRRAPLIVLTLNVIGICALGIIGYPFNAQVQMALVGIYTVGAHTGVRTQVAGVVIVVIGLVVSGIAGLPNATGADLVLVGAVYAGAFLFGSTVRNRRLYQGEVEARATELERERDDEARRAVAEERLRIAQELHDVVAHSMGVIAVQAGVGSHVIDRDPDEAKRSLEAISDTSRATLTEIRRILGVLRSDGGTAYQPAPGLADLDRLARDLEVAGLPVTITVEGERAGLPPGLDLTAYRIVQEALTNVLKHAGPARASVTIAYRPGAVSLRVVDDGRGVNGTVTDGGHGLVGMRERVGVYGGSLRSGPRSGGGFGVVADLPYGEAAE
jgi:signal transduction histidine kinase